MQMTYIEFPYAVKVHNVLSFVSGGNSKARWPDRAHEDCRNADRQSPHPGKEGRLLHQGEPPEAARSFSASFYDQPTKQPTGWN